MKPFSKAALAAYGILLLAPYALAQTPDSIQSSNQQVYSIPGDVGPVIVGGSSVAPKVSAVTSVSTTSTQIFPAGARNGFRIANTTAAGAGDLLCTDNSTTATATNWIIRVFAGTFDLESRPGPVSNQAINCVCTTSSCTLVAELY